jgi:hypothetical protein
VTLKRSLLKLHKTVQGTVITEIACIALPCALIDYGSLFIEKWRRRRTRKSRKRRRRKKRKIGLLDNRTLPSRTTHPRSIISPF